VILGVAADRCEPAVPERIGGQAREGVAQPVRVECRDAIDTPEQGSEEPGRFYQR